MEASDNELLKKVAQDDVPAFEAIYYRYYKSMYVYALKVIKKREVCEDIVQTVFVDLWSKRRAQHIVSLKAYLFQSVKYQIFNHLRNSVMSERDLSRLNIIDTSLTVSQLLEYKELEHLISQEVDKLPKRCQQIFILSRFQYKTNKEIAEELGISVQAVKNQISKALGFIRANITPEVALPILLFLVL